MEPLCTHEQRPSYYLGLCYLSKATLYVFEMTYNWFYMGQCK